MRRCLALARSSGVELVTTVTRFVRTTPWSDPTPRYRVNVALKGGGIGVGEGAEEHEALYGALANAGVAA